MNYEYINTDTIDQINTVAVDKPQSRNTLDVATLQELAAAIEDAQSSPETSVVVIRGEGEGVFIAGADVAEFKGQDSLWFKSEFREAFGDVESAIEEGRKPVIAAIDGVTLGGGLELSVMCDLVYATKSSSIGVPESKLGGMPGVGGTQRLTQLVGYLKAKEMVLTGEPVSAVEAEQIGLINQAIPDDEFEDKVANVASNLANGAPYAQWFAKEVINNARAGLDQGLPLEAALGAVLFETDDIHEGFGAFIEGRRAEFSNWDDL